MSKCDYGCILNRHFFNIQRARDTEYDWARKIVLMQTKIYQRKWQVMHQGRRSHFTFLVVLIVVLYIERLRIRLFNRRVDFTVGGINNYSVISASAAVVKQSKEARSNKSNYLSSFVDCLRKSYSRIKLIDAKNVG